MELWQMVLLKEFILHKNDIVKTRYKKSGISTLDNGY
jgi:hypothetical protein